MATSEAQNGFWQAREDGVLLLVRAQPGARRIGISGLRETEQGMALVVGVSEAPEKGRANKAIMAALAKALGVAKSALELRRGETARLKLVHVAGEPRALARRLMELVEEKGA